MLGLTTTGAPATAADITPLPREGEAKRRGRTTGQTGAIHRNAPPLPEGEKTPRKRRTKATSPTTRTGRASVGPATP